MASSVMVSKNFQSLTNLNLLFHFDTNYIFDCFNYCEKVECTTPKSSNYCFPSLDWNQFHYFRKLQFPLGTTFNQKLDTLLLAVIEIFWLPFIYIPKLKAIFFRFLGNSKVCLLKYQNL